MIIYIASVFATIVFGFLSHIKKGTFIYLVLMSIMLICIIGLRDASIGTDTNNYKTIYENLGNLSLESYISIYGYKEILFYFFNKLLFMAEAPYQLLILIEAIVTIVPIMFFLKNRPRYVWLSVLLFICMGNLNQSMNVSRQYLAIGLVFIAVNFAYKKKIIKFIIGVTVAVLFHGSAVVCFTLYPIINYKKRWFTSALVLAVPVLFAAKNSIIAIISRFVPSEYNYDSGGQGMTLLLLWVVLLVLIYYLRQYSDNPDVECALRVLSLSIMFQLFVSNYVVFGREAYYFSVLFYLLLSNVMLGFFAKDSRRIVAIVVSSLVIVYYFAFGLRGGASQTVPYLFFFEGVS